MKVINFINETLFWVQRTKLCIQLNDYESAIDRMTKANHSCDWISISMVYGE